MSKNWRKINKIFPYIVIFTMVFGWSFFPFSESFNFKNIKLAPKIKIARAASSESISTSTDGTHVNWTNPTNAWDASNNLYASRDLPKKGVDDSANYLEASSSNAVDLGGEITAVEIGIEGYVEEAAVVSANLVPMFDGTTAGAGSYSVDGATLGETPDVDTVHYQTITGDTNGPQAGNWTWSDISNLHIRIDGFDSSNASTRFLYIDQIYIKVTYSTTDTIVSTTGTQESSIVIGAVNTHIGGAFTATSTASTTITSITITEDGTIDAQNNLDNIKLYYEKDETDPYNCASVSYDGGEAMFGSPDTDGFSGANGVSTFVGSAQASSTSALCLYTVLDVLTSAGDQNSIDIKINNPSTDVVSNSNTVIPATAVEITGTTYVTGPKFTQSAYRFYENDASTAIGTSLTAAQDQAAVLSSKGQAFRLRTLMHVASSSLATSSLDFALHFATKGGGTCASPAGSYATVTPSTIIAFNDNGGVNDGDLLTASSTADPTHGGDLIVNQTYEEDNNFTSTSTIAEGRDGKWDFALKDNGAAASTTYCFKIVKASDSSDLYNYEVYPEITTRPNNAPVNDSLDLLAHNDDEELYAGSQYTWRVLVTDADGYDDVNLVILQLDYDGTSQDIIWTRSTDIFSSASGYFTVDSIGTDSNNAGNQWTLDFKLTMDWDWANTDDAPTDAQVVSDDIYYATTTNAFTGDTFQVENDLRTTSITYDSTHNPGVSFSVSGYLDYEGVTTPDPPEDIADVRVDPNWSASNYDDTDLEADGYFSVSGVIASSTLNNTDTFDVDILNAPAGAGAISSNGNTMDIDRVQITNIVASNHAYDSGTRYWDPNADSMTATISAILERGGGPINVGTSTLISNSFSGGASANVSENSAIFSAGSAATTLSAASYAVSSNSATYDDLDITSISVSTNSYGTAFSMGSGIDEASEQPNVGWDDAVPTGGSLAWGTITSSNIDVTPSAGADADSGLPTNKYYMAYDQATSFSAADANSGWVNTAWSPGGLSANLAYAYVLKLIDNVGNESVWVYPSPVYKYTLANTPNTAGHSNQAVDSMRWTWASGGSQTDYIYGTDSNCLSGSTANTYWDEGSLSANTAYTRYACARNTDGATSSSLTIGPFYTEANTPTTPGHTNQTDAAMRWTWASGGAETDYSYGTDTNCSGGNTSNTYWDEGSLSANTAYTRYACARNGDTDKTGSLTIGPFYTSANAPNAPTVNNPGVSTLDVDPNTGGAEKNMALYMEIGATCDGSGGWYITAGGATTTSAVWQTEAAWSTVTVNNLSVNIQYSFCAKATNENDDETAFGVAGSAYSGANIPLAPTVNNPNASTLDVNPVTGGSEKNMALYMEIGATCDGSGGWYITAGGATTTSAVWQTEAAWDTVTITNLNSNTQYSFCAKATNENDAETAFGAAGLAYSGASTPTTAGHSNQAVDFMRWTWASGGSQADYIYGTDSNCLSGSTANTYWDEGSLSANTVYTRYACARNVDGATSTSLTIGPFYTEANTPTTPGHTNQTTVAMRWTWASGGAETDYAYGTDSNCSSGTTGNAYWDEGSLSANTAYTRYACSRNADTDISTSLAIGPFYTSANAPNAPTVNNPGVSTLDVDPNTGGAEKNMALYMEIGATCDGSGGWYITAGGATTTSAVWQTEAAWSTVTVNNLSVNIQYSFCAKATNENDDETAFGAVGSSYCGASVPSAPTVNNPGVSTLDVNPNSGGSEKNMALYMEIGATCDGSGGWYITAGGATTTSAVWQTEAAWDTVTVTSLSVNNQYSFCAKATNENDDETAFGASGSAYSGANVPVTPGHTNQTDVAMRWTWASGGAETDYAYGTDSNCTSGNTSNTYWDEGSLSANTAYTRYACARNADAVKSSSLTIGPFYTSANVPATPTVGNPGSNSLDVNPNTGGVEKEMAIYMEQGGSCDGSGGSYINGSGATSTTAVWQTDVAWDTVTVNDLLIGTTYSFCVKATNENDDETTFGSAGSSSTGDPPAPYRFEGGFNIFGGMTFY